MVGVALKKMCGGGKYTILHQHTKTASKREREAERERGREGDVGVRLLKHSKMMGNYISNYQWEQERTPSLWCSGKRIKCSKISKQ